MSERDEGDRLEQALEHVRRDADHGPLPRGGFSDMERRRRRRRLDTGLGAVAAAAVLAGLVWAGWGMWSLGRESPAAPSARPAIVGPGPTAGMAAGRPDAGSVLYVAERGARVRELGARVFAVDAGTVWFSVAPGSGRMEVRSPDRTIVVVGTVFAVSVTTTSGAAETTVGVLDGHVRVEPRRGAMVELYAGQQLAPTSVAVVPLEAAWRERMTSLFPERVALESSRAAPDAMVTSAGGAAPGAASGGFVPGAPAASNGVAGAGAVAPVPGDAEGFGASSPPPGATGLPAPGAVTTSPRPDGTGVAGMGAETPAAAGRGAPGVAAPRAGADPGSTAPDRDVALPAPAFRPAASWDERYGAAEALLASDPALAAAQLEELVVTVPSRGREERVLLELAQIYAGKLRDLPRTRDAYERYLERFPGGSARQDVVYNLCQVLGAQGDGEAQTRCLEEYLDEFPNGSRAEAVRRQLGIP
ncbi:MAG: FecR domain-containing protein [Deltaproteobacteria bacterium]|nr:FecR domain-containing protein [Deltaproteobacteria bacterium]